MLIVLDDAILDDATFLLNINHLCRNTYSGWKKQRNMTIDCWVQSKSFSSVTHSGTVWLDILGLPFVVMIAHDGLL